MNLPKKPLAEQCNWDIKQRQTVFQSPWFRLHSDSIRIDQEHDIQYSYVDHPGAVFVVPETSDGKIILTRAYRYPMDMIGWELPSGTLGDKPDKTIEDMAREELLEEAGAVPGEMIYLGAYYLAKGFTDFLSYFYLATNTEIVQARETEPAEKIFEVKAFEYHEVLAMAMKGELKDGETWLGILMAKAMPSGSQLGTAPSFTGP